MPTLTTDNIQINYSDSGTGTPVLLLHGYPDSIALWRKVEPLLLAAGYRVICIDQRGFGQSDAPLGKENYKLSRMGADALAVLDALGLSRVHLVGHDWGSAIGWVLAGRHPERFLSFTALSFGHSRAYTAAGFEQLRKAWYLFLFLVPGLPERIVPRNDWKMLREATRHAEVERWVADLARPGRFLAAMNLYRANVLSPESHPNLKMPVMGVWSDDDLALTEAQMTKSARYVDGPFRYERIEGASHWIPLDAPERLVDLLVDFFRQNGES